VVDRVRNQLSRRRTLLILLVVGGTVALASAVTAYGTVSHYKGEHEAALRAQRQRSGDQAEIARLNSQLRDLTQRLDRTSGDLSYALKRTARFKAQIARLGSTVSSLQEAAVSAKSAATTRYNAGYDAGFADAQAATPTDTGGGQGCDPNYEGACVPTDMGDVDCGDLVETDFDVVGYDVDGLDGDGDGIACESY
jgi:TolA-binding protein